MDRRKLGIGAFLATVGALGIVLGPLLGLTDLGFPWSFLAGFVTGLLAGLGATLSISVLLDLRRTTGDKGWGLRQ